MPFGTGAPTRLKRGWKTAAGERAGAGVRKSAAAGGGRRSGERRSGNGGQVHPARGGNRDAGPGRGRRDDGVREVADGDPGSYHGLCFPGAAAA